jgi:CrcB protein
MEFAINRPWADNSYRSLEKILREDAIVNYLWIAVGAVVGAGARYFLSGFIARNVSAAFPYGTLLINITGSLALGFFLVYSAERVLLDPRWRLLVAIGFCGSYTTFSSYAFESFALMEQGQWLLVGLNVLGSNLLCLAAVLAGAALARGL